MDLNGLGSEAFGCDTSFLESNPGVGLGFSLHSALEVGVSRITRPRHGGYLVKSTSTTR